jgi:hypothetical protein
MGNQIVTIALGILFIYMAILIPPNVVKFIDRLFILLFGAVVTSVIFIINSSPSNKIYFSELHFKSKLSRCLYVSLAVSFCISGLILPITLLYINKDEAINFIFSIHWFLMLLGVAGVCFPFVWAKIK